MARVRIFGPWELAIWGFPQNVPYARPQTISYEPLFREFLSTVPNVIKKPPVKAVLFLAGHIVQSTDC